jgi:hypothetical protein
MRSRISFLTCREAAERLEFEKKTLRETDMGQVHAPMISADLLRQVDLMAHLVAWNLSPALLLLPLAAMHLTLRTRLLKNALLLLNNRLNSGWLSGLQPWASAHLLNLEKLCSSVKSVKRKKEKRNFVKPKRKMLVVKKKGSEDLPRSRLLHRPQANQVLRDLLRHLRVRINRKLLNMILNKLKLKLRELNMKSLRKLYEINKMLKKQRERGWRMKKEGRKKRL